MAKILRQTQTENKVGLPPSTMYRKIDEGTFPKPIKIGTRAVGWLESELDEWIEGRIKATRGE